MHEINKLILGDNLEILKNLDSETIDLIYLDPPFFSNRSYEIVWGDSGEVRSFEDRFSGGIDHYIAWLKERVIEMHRILKPTGSIFLHCDYHADAYIRVEILDKIFGGSNFRNHLIWKRTNTPKGSQFSNKSFGVVTDTIFWYSKSVKYYFDDIIIRNQIEEDNIETKYPKIDEKGRYYEYPILRSASKGERPNLVYEYKGFTPDIWGWVILKEKLVEMDERGDLGWRKNGKPYRKFRPYEDPGQLINNIWDDIIRIQSNSKEAIGYPTQKPMALLQRILEMASKKGDVVLDPFMGGGTTIAVADKLERKWMGIDQSVQAVKVTEFRLDQQQDLFCKPFIVQLHKYDYDTLRYKDAFEFENFIVTAFGGRPNTKQRGDLGLDGKTLDNVPIQVKRSDAIGRNVVDNFLSAIQRNDKPLYEKNKAEGKAVGYIIAFSFGKGAVQEVARLKNSENVIIKLVTVEEIIPIAKKPSLVISITDNGKDSKGLTEIKFFAKANSEAGVEFFSWDFNYKTGKFKPEVLFDKSGEQSNKFKAGTHTIAVKVVDNDGLESIESLKLKINGDVVLN